MLFAYFELQSGRMHAEALSYPLLNLVGSVLILVSLMYTFNFASFVIEIAWILISLMGLYRVLRHRARR